MFFCHKKCRVECRVQSEKKNFTFEWFLLGAKVISSFEPSFKLESYSNWIISAILNKICMIRQNSGTSTMLKRPELIMVILE